MDFEDIVDMDWIDSNTTSDDSLATSSGGPVAIKQEPMEHHSPFQTTAFDADSLYRFTEQPFLWQQDLTNSASASVSCSSPVSPSSSSSLPDKDDDHPMSKQDVKLPPELMMPSTEHIKQLIEIAKRHLALREQGLRPEDIHGAAAAAAAAAAMPLFTTTPTVIPDTIAPESLMKLSAAAAVAMNADNQSTSTSPPPPVMEKKTSDVKKPSSTTPPPTSTRRASSVSLGEETMTLEAYAESDGIDIKKLTPKERRQLRNKISARNFRVRRKGK